jgi:hypothetical protein
MEPLKQIRWVRLLSPVHLTPDIVEYEAGATAPMYDLIVGKQTSIELQREDHYHR